MALAVRRTSAKEVMKFVDVVWDSTDGEYDETLQKLVLDPVLGQLIREFRDVCTSDCQRVYTDPIELSEREIENYWQRFTISPSEPDSTHKDRGILTIEQDKKPCNVGFKLDQEHRCPLLELEEQKQRTLEPVLITIEGVLKHRSPLV